VEGVPDLAASASTVMRVTLATLGTLLACQGGSRAFWAWAIAWWTVASVSWIPGPDGLGLLPTGLVMLLGLLTWRHLWRSTTWARACAVVGLGLVASRLLALVLDPLTGTSPGLAGELLVGCAVFLAAVEAARDEARAAQERLAISERRLHQTVTWDPLTECFTRPVFRDLVDRVRGGEAEERGVLLVFDMDGLKRINDLSGHSAGDKAIRRTGLAIKRRLREKDLALRWGGDEFVVVLPGASREDGRQMRRRILATLRREGLSASAGSATYGSENDIVAALREADARMYAVKRRRQKARLPAPRQLDLPLLPGPSGSPTPEAAPLALDGLTVVTSKA
jgi:diguanylate cyclase (GGDEF)-like protein